MVWNFVVFQSFRKSTDMESHSVIIYGGDTPAVENLPLGKLLPQSSGSPWNESNPSKIALLSFSKLDQYLIE